MLLIRSVGNQSQYIEVLMHKYSTDNTNSYSICFKSDLKLQCIYITLDNLLIPELNSLINT